MQKISIIIPVLNEVTCIEDNLPALQCLRDLEHEIIVVDGGSMDETIEIAEKYSNKVITCNKGRAMQMNAGANIANGEILLFLHVDTRLPQQVDHLIESATSGQDKFWGFFQVKLSSEKKMFRVIEYFMNKRSSLSSIGTGDQALFISKKLFKQVGGYDHLSLMEDIAICKKLKKLYKPIVLQQVVTTSSRRWEKNGVVFTIFQMWYLRLAFYLGADSSFLAKKYYG